MCAGQSPPAARVRRRSVDSASSCDAPAGELGVERLDLADHRRRRCSRPARRRSRRCRASSRSAGSSWSRRIALGQSRRIARRHEQTRSCPGGPRRECRRRRSRRPAGPRPSPRAPSSETPPSSSRGPRRRTVRAGWAAACARRRDGRCSRSRSDSASASIAARSGPSPISTQCSAGICSRKRRDRAQQRAVILDRQTAAPRCRRRTRPPARRARRACARRSAGGDRLERLADRGSSGWSRCATPARRPPISTSRDTLGLLPDDAVGEPVRDTVRPQDPPLQVRRIPRPPARDHAAHAGEARADRPEDARVRVMAVDDLGSLAPQEPDQTHRLPHRLEARGGSSSERCAPGSRHPCIAPSAVRSSRMQTTETANRAGPAAPPFELRSAPCRPSACCRYSTRPGSGHPAIGRPSVPRGRDGVRDGRLTSADAPAT